MKAQYCSLSIQFSQTGVGYRHFFALKYTPRP